MQTEVSFISCICARKQGGLTLWTMSVSTGLPYSQFWPTAYKMKNFYLKSGRERVNGSTAERLGTLTSSAVFSCMIYERQRSFCQESACSPSQELIERFRLEGTPLLLRRGFETCP